MIRRRVYPDGDLHMEIGIVLGDLLIRQRHEQPATAFRETVGTEIGGNPTDRSPIPPEGNPLIPFAAFLLKFPKQAGGKNDLTPFSISSQSFFSPSMGRKLNTSRKPGVTSSSFTYSTFIESFTSTCSTGSLPYAAWTSAPRPPPPHPGRS